MVLDTSVKIPFVSFSMGNSSENFTMYFPPNQGAREEKLMLSGILVIAFNTDALTLTAICSAIGSTGNHPIIADRPLIGAVLKAPFNMSYEVPKNLFKMRV